MKKLKYPNASKDSQGRLRVAGGDWSDGGFPGARGRGRFATAWIALAIDSAHGHSIRVLEAVAEVKKAFPDVDLLAGNVATYRRHDGADGCGR